MLQKTYLRYDSLVIGQNRPIPSKGKHKKEIRHTDLVDAIRETLHLFGWRDSNWCYALSKDKYGFACSFELKIPGLKFKGIKPSMAFQHSNDGKKKLRCCLGGVFLEKHSSPGFVFDPLHGEQKHTIHFDLDKYLMEEMGRAEVAFDTLQKSHQEEMSRVLCTTTQDHILCEVGRRKKMGWRQIGQVINALRSKELLKKKTTVRDVLLAYGEVVGQLPPLKQLESLSCLREVVLREIALGID